MEKILRIRLRTCILILVLVCTIFVFAGDVTVKEGTIEGEVFKSTNCYVSGTKAIALGEESNAEGDCSAAIGYGTEAVEAYSMAMGYLTTASGIISTAIGSGTTASGAASTSMGNGTLASGSYSTAMGSCTDATQFCSMATGYWTEATAYYATAFGKYSTNNVANSFTVGYGSGLYNRKVDFRVEHGQEGAVVTVGDMTSNPKTGDLYVGRYAWAVEHKEYSCFYDKDIYGKALDYVEDISKIIKINSEGKKEYNHEADPEFLKAWITLTDYDKYTDKEVWNEQLQGYEPERIYQTHQELGTNLSMKVAWLRQCVYELKQENGQLKAELGAIKAKLGME